MTGRRALAALLTLGLAGCAGTAVEPNPADGGPRRVVVMAPAAAEILEALDLLDRVVGVGEFGPWPERLAGVPAVGGYDTPNQERVLALGCDAVITSASEAAVVSHERLAALGIRVIALETGTFDGVFESLATLGDEFGRRGRADEIAAELRDEIDEVAARAAAAPPRRVLIVVGRDPLYVAGPGSHLDRLLTIAGGVNVAGDPGPSYRRISLEAILERAPEIIVDTSDNSPGAPHGRRAGAWARWESLPAVREGRVYQVHPGRLVIPGMRLPEMAALMGRLVHPEIFGPPSDDGLGPST